MLDFRRRRTKRRRRGAPTFKGRRGVQYVERITPNTKKPRIMAGRAIPGKGRALGFKFVYDALRFDNIGF